MTFDKIKSLFFMGYPKDEYDLLPDGLLRGARRSFKFQIKIFTFLSLVWAGNVLITNLLPALSFARYKINSFVVYNALAIFVCSLISIKSKIACIVTALLYLASSGYLLVKADSEYMLIFNILAVVLYVKLFFAHMHLGYIKKRGNIDGISAFKAMAGSSDGVNLSLQMLFNSQDESNDFSNSEKVRFENAFGVDVGGDKDLKEKTIVDLLNCEVSEYTPREAVPQIELSIDKIKEKASAIVDKISGAESEEKSRLEWLVMMKSDKDEKGAD